MAVGSWRSQPPGRAIFFYADLPRAEQPLHGVCYSGEWFHNCGERMSTIRDKQRQSRANDSGNPASQNPRAAKR